MAETRSPRPVLLAVDDAHALAKRARELSDRYGEDYRVVCLASAELGLVELERCEADSEQVALMLADRLIELVAQLYRRVAHYGREGSSRVDGGLGLAAITNGPTGLIELGSAPHAAACGQAYCART
jgi:hypothetical protein